MNAANQPNDLNQSSQSSQSNQPDGLSLKNTATVSSIFTKMTKSWSLKIVTLIILTLLLGIPTFWIDSMVSERSKYFNQAVGAFRTTV